MTRPACYGLFELFDSTNPTDHAHARALCDHCPVIAACRTNLHDEMSRIPGGRPVGTWAGRLFTNAPGSVSKIGDRGAA